MEREGYYSVVINARGTELPLKSAKYVFYHFSISRDDKVQILASWTCR